MNTSIIGVVDTKLETILQVDAVTMCSLIRLEGQIFKAIERIHYSGPFETTRKDKSEVVLVLYHMAKRKLYFYGPNGMKLTYEDAIDFEKHRFSLIHVE